MDGEAKFSILERYGENYTEKEYITNPAIGRDQQIKELLLILLRSCIHSNDSTSIVKSFLRVTLRLRLSKLFISNIKSAS